MLYDRYLRNKVCNQFHLWLMQSTRLLPFWYPLHTEQLIFLYFIAPPPFLQHKIKWNCYVIMIILSQSSKVTWNRTRNLNRKVKSRKCYNDQDDCSEIAPSIKRRTFCLLPSLERYENWRKLMTQWGHKFSEFGSQLMYRLCSARRIERCNCSAILN